MKRTNPQTLHPKRGQGLVWPVDSHDARHRRQPHLYAVELLDSERHVTLATLPGHGPLLLPWNPVRVCKCDGERAGKLARGLEPGHAASRRSQVFALWGTAGATRGLDLLLGAHVMPLEPACCRAWGRHLQLCRESAPTPSSASIPRSKSTAFAWRRCELFKTSCLMQACVLCERGQGFTGSNIGVNIEA